MSKSIYRWVGSGAVEPIVGMLDYCWIDGAPAPVWHPVGGNSIELGDTGWRIERVTDPARFPFAGYDPDGRPFGAAFQLKMLKDAADEFAADWAEFNLPPGAWKGPTL